MNIPRAWNKYTDGKAGGVNYLHAVEHPSKSVAESERKSDQPRAETEHPSFGETEGAPVVTKSVAGTRSFTSAPSRW
jgi:hypothetical protein